MANGLLSLTRVLVSHGLVNDVDRRTQREPCTRIKRPNPTSQLPNPREEVTGGEQETMGPTREVTLREDNKQNLIIKTSHNAYNKHDIFRELT